MTSQSNFRANIELIWCSVFIMIFFQNHENTKWEQYYGTRTAMHRSDVQLGKRAPSIVGLNLQAMVSRCETDIWRSIETLTISRNYRGFVLRRSLMEATYLLVQWWKDISSKNRLYVFCFSTWTRHMLGYHKLFLQYTPSHHFFLVQFCFQDSLWHLLRF